MIAYKIMRIEGDDERWCEFEATSPEEADRMLQAAWGAVNPELMEARMAADRLALEKLSKEPK